MSTTLRSIAASLSLLLGQAAWADACHLTIDVDDKMQFSQRQLEAPDTCAELELTLRHVGSQSARVMGHDWVLAKTADVSALSSAGLAAGLQLNYQPPADKRVIAGTKVIGGGETTSVRFSTAGMQPGGDYTFFCSSPGHVATMKGVFSFGVQARKLAAQKG